ncbi:MAG TPA: hypothetical protein VMA77_18185, partial [Solirubrobacteraceae bacterium]|nr:hypothetical protein [Solirubrobacteraceae bacterium]
MSRDAVRGWALRIACVLGLLGAGAVALPPAAAPADSTAPLVFLTAPSSPLRGDAFNPETFSAYAQASAGRTITSVVFEYRPAGSGANNWTTFPGTPDGSRPNGWDGSLDTTTLQNGTYDFAAVAADSTGESATSAIASDLTVANDSTYVALSSPGSPVAGQVTLTATSEIGGSTPDTINFDVCPTSSDCPANGGWRQLASVAPQPDPNTGALVAKYTLDTTTLPDGSYDLSVTASDVNTVGPPGDPFQGGVVGDVVLDNTAPTVTLNNPGSSISGVTTLTVSTQDSGTGVAAVRFEVAPAGTGNWTTVGVASSPPYLTSFDTRQFSDGSYDIRAQAADNAGNTATSATVSGIGISNPGATPFGGLTVTDYLPPATNIHLIGELPGAEHETWAIGQTNAPPPIVNGASLPYTAQGNGQVVLLRYTDDAGWQIVDVLRNPDGTAFQLIPGGTFAVSGTMTSSGEAWIGFKETTSSSATFGVFHRLPGGPFELDSSATSTLRPLLIQQFTMRLGQAADGSVYGILFGTAPSVSQNVLSPSGPVNISTSLEYGQLMSGAWTLQGSSLPANYTAPSGVSSINLVSADLTGPGTGWAALQQSNGPLVLARFNENGWSFVAQTGLDVLDLTGPFAPGSQQSAAAGPTTVSPIALRADGGGVWLSARTGGGAGSLIARFNEGGQLVDSWCTGLLQSSGCANPLDVGHPAAVPDAVFETDQGAVADALGNGVIDVYYHGAWTSVAAPGFSGGAGNSVFVDPTDGWLAGTNTLARVTALPLASTLAPWPEANRNPLLSVALPPGQSTTDTPGALAVGLNGTALHYDASAGWQVDPTPVQTHHIELTGVAFASPSLAFAVGQVGTILRWDGTSWTEDPQSVQVTTATLNAVAFGSDGQGWAVGGFGTILHYDGSSWSTEQIDSQDSSADITSVAVAGEDVFAIAGGNLVMRTPGGVWQRVTANTTPALPSPAPPVGSLQLVSGLPDGGVAVVGKSLLMVRESASGDFAYSPHSFNGIPVALAAFRDPSGNVQAFVSVAPPISSAAGLTNNVGGFPAGDGDLILDTAGGWQDLSRDLPANSTFSVTGDGTVQPDPVLAVAASSDGSHAWAVGGYSGTQAADGVGTGQILAARPADWFTSAIWRYDAGGSATSQAVAQTSVTLPANPNTVSFAFFSSALCKVQCSARQDAQPDVNLNTAAGQIAAFAGQPGGPAFAMVGGNIRGGMSGLGSDPVDMSHLPQLLSPLSGVPTYAAYGPLDDVPSASDPALPWAEAFATAPAPFGPGGAPPGITPQGSGDADGPVNRYYAFDVAQNGGALRAIVLDNAAGSLDASAAGQTAWLSGELAQAQAAGLPVVVFAAEPLNINDPGAASDADAVAAQLAAAGVLAVFTTSGGEINTWQTQQDQVAQVPADAPPGAPQVPEYEGATLTYQQPGNNGVLWYDASVNTATRTVSVSAVPVISDLALEADDGLSVQRSSTLSFQAIARRPSATIATGPLDPTFPGYGQYVNIPSKACSGCIGPSYSFTSSNPVVGNFVAASAPGSPFPKLTATGATTASSTSGLFCAFNSGTTTVSVTSGLLTSSLEVTVAAGGFGPPCGTVPGGTSTNTITVPGRTIVKPATNPGIGNPNTPLGQSSPVQTPLPKIAVPPPPLVVVTPHVVAHKAKVISKNAPVTIQPGQTTSPIQQGSNPGLPVLVPPLIPPALTPVPPGGATVSAQATARREERQRKHASQSAYVTRPA